MSFTISPNPQTGNFDTQFPSDLQDLMSKDEFQLLIENSNQLAELLNQNKKRMKKIFVGVTGSFLVLSLLITIGMVVLIAFLRTELQEFFGSQIAFSLLIIIPLVILLIFYIIFVLVLWPYVYYSKKKIIKGLASYLAEQSDHNFSKKGVQLGLNNELVSIWDIASDDTLSIEVKTVQIPLDDKTKI